MVKRLRGSRTMARRRGRHEPFDRLVARAVAAVPSPFRQALDRMAIVIADEPSPELLRDEGLGPDETLYGIYQPPVDALYSWGDAFEPERIVIFRLPLEEDFPDPDDLADEVRITILHELAHALGIDDEERLAQLGID